jgi:uncharacterized membrane protein YeaQ/YmgE (transglycosylase-associated protein family)
VLGTIVSVLASGLVIGWLARWGVPGPDPMPIWLTFLFGFGGSLVGGLIAYALLGGVNDLSSADYFTIVLAEILAAMLLIILYRRFVQGRPITGPDAHAPPTKGIGLGRSRRGPRSLRQPSRTELLERLDVLHDQGVLTDEEYRAKRVEVLRRQP